jgi:hypothetical protein
MLMLTAYMDESGHQADRVVIAGFWGDRTQWGNLEVAWRAALSTRKALHMRTLRWHKPERLQPLLSRLAPLPYQCGLKPLFATVCVSDYADLIVGGPRAKLYKSYLVALMPLLLLALKETPQNEQLKFVFDRQRHYEPFAKEMIHILDRYKTPSGKTRITSIEFTAHDSNLLTQPADYLAYAIAQVYADPHSLRSNLCAPIMQYDFLKAIPAIPSREQVREALSWIVE